MIATLTDAGSARATWHAENHRLSHHNLVWQIGSLRPAGIEPATCGLEVFNVPYDPLLQPARPIGFAGFFLR